MVGDSEAADEREPEDTITALVVLVISGCSTAPVPLSSAKQAPLSRVLAFQDRDAERTANIIIIRGRGFVAGGLFYGRSPRWWLGSKIRYWRSCKLLCKT